MSFSSSTSTRGQSQSQSSSSGPKIIQLPTSPLAKFKFQEKTRSAIQTRSDQIQFIHDQLQNELKAIDHEIKLDTTASEQYQKQLDKLERRKQELFRVIRQQHEFTNNFDEQIGPFEARYEELQHSVDGLHAAAKVKYDAALQLLIDKLNYHPSFKRHNDTI